MLGLESDTALNNLILPNFKDDVSIAIPGCNNLQHIVNLINQSKIMTIVYNDTKGVLFPTLTALKQSDYSANTNIK